MKYPMIELGLARFATPEEISTFEKVDALLEKVSDETFDNIVSAISDYAFDYQGTRKYYQRVYRIAKKLGLKTSELLLWYYVEN